MESTELTTLIIALAALLTSVVSVLEMRRQRANDARPVLVVIEKHEKADDTKTPLILYLVNMGNSVAMNIDVAWKCDHEASHRREPIQSEVAAGRRVELMRGHKERCIGKVKLDATYRDINGIPYKTTYDPKRRDKAHRFARAGWLGFVWDR